MCIKLPHCFVQPIVTQFGEELKGDERVVVDQLISRQQCERLIELATVSSRALVQLVDLYTV